MTRLENCLFLFTVAIIRVAIYIVPPTVQVLLVVLLPPVADTVIVVCAILTCVLAVIIGFFLLRFNVHVHVQSECYSIGECAGIYSVQTLGPLTITLLLMNILCAIPVTVPGRLKGYTGSAWLWAVVLAPIPLFLVSWALWGATERTPRKISNFVVAPIFVLSYFIPLISEATILGMVDIHSYAGTSTILTSSIIQSLIAIFSGAMLLYDMAKNGEKFYPCQMDILDPKTLISAKFTLQTGSIWFVTNVICSWVVATQLPWWVHILCYVPVAMYFIGVLAGYTMKESGMFEKETEKEPLI